MEFATATDLPRTVGLTRRVAATFPHMGWGDYWRDVCAPRLLAKKKELGRKLPDREIAAAVEAATGKPSERSLVWMWLHGEREPFVSQFFALCEKLGVQPEAILKADRKQVRERTPLKRTGRRDMGETGMKTGISKLSRSK